MNNKSNKIENNHVIRDKIRFRFKDFRSIDPIKINLVVSDLTQKREETK